MLRKLRKKCESPQVDELKIVETKGVTKVIILAYIGTKMLVSKKKKAYEVILHLINLFNILISEIYVIMSTPFIN